MLTLLYETIEKELPALLDDPSKWDSLIINKRKPHTYRVFTQLGKVRLCLHKFNPCDKHEAFFHPHPWPAAFTILSGCYHMYTGHSRDRESDPVPVADMIMTAGSAYSIMLPWTWHMIVPVDTTYTVMVNGEPWSPDIAHSKVRTTKGKDLEKLKPEELVEQLAVFKTLVSQWRSHAETLNAYKRLLQAREPPPPPKKLTITEKVLAGAARAFDFFDGQPKEKKDVPADEGRTAESASPTADSLQDGGQQGAGDGGAEGVAVSSE